VFSAPLLAGLFFSSRYRLSLLLQVNHAAVPSSSQRSPDTAPQAPARAPNPPLTTAGYLLSA
jgi:hypothetical protein